MNEVNMWTWNDSTFATAGEAVAALIENYAGVNKVLNAPLALRQRWRFAVRTCDSLQLEAAEFHDTSDLDENEVALIMSSREMKLQTPAVWNHKAPLYLIATDFTPTTDIPVPTGNVQLIDPSTDETLLFSLQDVGLTPPQLDV